MKSKNFVINQIPKLSITIIFVVLIVTGCKNSCVSDSIKILDTPEIIAEMEKARSLAGNDTSLIVTQRLQSRDLNDDGIPTIPSGANTDGSETYVEPTQLFDNLYYVGGADVGSFIFTTPEGYIMIDAGYEYSPEKLIIPGMKALGLDPAKIRYLMITHAGPDHIGGAKYFQENYGTQIVMSQQEWDAILKRKEGQKKKSATQNAPNSNPNQQRGMASIVFPEKDIVGVDGQKLTLGNTTITIVHTPRRVNGGGLSYIAPVFSDGEMHMWATYGNTNVVGTLEDKKVYRNSVKHFLTYTDAAKVDVVISNHPFVDGSLELMKKLRNKKTGEPNPFVYGQERARRFFEVLDQCALVLAARQEFGLDETGTKRLEN